MVLIEREKPKSCSCCWYDKICKRWMTHNWGSPPPADCPLKEIPPHGRLIDEDVLIKTAKGVTENTYPLSFDALEVFSMVPTVIPAEQEEETCTKN